MRRASTLLNASPHLQTALRVLGALLLLFVGLDHYYEYSAQSYSVIPTIGTLFLLNFISATAIGVLLLAPLERITGRFGLLAVRVAAVSGFAIASSSLLALLVSEQTKLFGFMESNYRPAILVAIASEAAAAVVLALVALSTAPESAQMHGPAHDRSPGPADEQRVGPAC
ncbi:hypothetical protein AYO39_02045 [Actinobacteria bacterium SCGC AG-212-D09]|nr:hypothetical protein AYO39_02045 [Actinobacteria bacterium SCGC AG-212-D09]